MFKLVGFTVAFLVIRSLFKSFFFVQNVKQNIGKTQKKNFSKSDDITDVKYKVVDED
jgi:hypothetical protein